MKCRHSYLITLLSVTLFFSCQKDSNTSKWKKTTLLFDDDGKSNWKENWMMDGLLSKVINTDEGMELIAGPHAYNDSSHTVLWTKRVFEGDILIEYDYTRTDTAKRFVNILYFHATGSGDSDHPQDIKLWNDLREIPYMKTYYNHMNLYHISYAAFDPKGDNDYVRLRRYIPNGSGLEGTDIKGDQLNTDLFKPHDTYHIEVSKYGNQIEMVIKSDQDSVTYAWDVSEAPQCQSGRIGLRHMWTRSARYKNFKVWQLSKS